MFNRPLRTAAPLCGSAAAPRGIFDSQRGLVTPAKGGRDCYRRHVRRGRSHFCDGKPVNQSKNDFLADLSHSSRAIAPTRRRDQPGRILRMPARRCRRLPIGQAPVRLRKSLVILGKSVKGVARRQTLWVCRSGLWAGLPTAQIEDLRRGTVWRGKQVPRQLPFARRVNGNDCVLTDTIPT